MKKMNTMMKINQIWEDLENEQSLRSGLLYKRYSGTVIPDVYVAIRAPEKFRCIAAHLSSSVELKTEKWDKLKDIKIEILKDENQTGKHFLLILLLNNQHRDIFSTLCEDLIQQVSEIKTENELIKNLMSRLEKWRLLFERIGQQGLPEEAQRGLYGELYFLRKFLKKTSDYLFCIETWKGPDKAIQDFQFSDWGVEIKTTHGKNHQKIQIASERQLDTSIVPNIYLHHISLDVRSDHGETLVDIIKEIYGILDTNPTASNNFRLKLMDANYFDIHTWLYNTIGYSIRQEKLYKISDNFPRLTESQIPSGVGDVRYTVVVSDNEEWIIDEDKLFESLIKK